MQAYNLGQSGRRLIRGVVVSSIHLSREIGIVSMSEMTLENVVDD